jgi:virulence-associated protein VapD
MKKDNIYRDSYNTVKSAIKVLNKAEYELAQGSYLSEKEQVQLEAVLYLLSRKQSTIETDMHCYEDFEKYNYPLPVNDLKEVHNVQDSGHIVKA